MKEERQKRKKAASLKSGNRSFIFRRQNVLLHLRFSYSFTNGGLPLPTKNHSLAIELHKYAEPPPLPLRSPMNLTLCHAGCRGATCLVKN